MNILLGHLKNCSEVKEQADIKAKLAGKKLII